jgi:transposase-like protein
MAKGWSPWREGRRAWGRLESWVPGHASAPSARVDDADEALNALSDVGLVRRLLDQAELAAVRASRRTGKSWAEIATRLGITRQSAWERWRDLDEAAPESIESIESTREQMLGQVARELADEMLEPPDKRRRRSTITVPNVIGMSWDRARQVLSEKTLVAVGPDPDGPPLAALGWPSGVVVDQSPESGAKVPPGTSVRLWLESEGGGSAGVREPRRPSPDPKSAREMRYEPTDEAVS